MKLLIKGKIPNYKYIKKVQCSKFTTHKYQLLSQTTQSIHNVQFKANKSVNT